MDLDLDLTVTEIEFRLSGEDFVLQEASEDAVVRYRNQISRSAKIEDGSLSGMAEVADADPFLLSLCLYRVTPSGRKPVPLTEIRSWPRRVTRKLFEKLEEISELGSRETPEQLRRAADRIARKLAKVESAKNEPSGLPT